MSSHRESSDLPLSSQSHFAKFEDFTPNDDASFDQEFARLASSQNWIPGSQQYTQERTIAIREELKFHYFPQAVDKTNKNINKKDKLDGYQSLCREVGIPPHSSITKCKKELKNTLVNIVDFIDSRRVGKGVKVWQDFNAFCEYTREDEHRIDVHEAKKDGGYLASLLQRLPSLGRRGAKAGKSRSGPRVVISGRVARKRQH
ncbi:hypothetical protein M406DRAFT_245551 [Cryphonectria parasitica EP155]|uniref:Uncharacterized protein n=1 Tax=Cryphonectria parasitica (strain ATCC 38755 / EP155) TaxID=660469 RepID=A0A9P5CTS3_CRYP1|nr:uncharacterized protein M406DRAFT_245551 [Cryphonectria parasitica EP155]KAF3769415.1 hypothetical protein M406DRAFT_245551 [Cryphonectria parasitica EP155]